MTQNVMDSGRWVESKCKKNSWTLISLEPLFQTSAASPAGKFPCPWGRMKSPLTFSYIWNSSDRSWIILVSSSFFVQGPLKAKQFWGKCVLRDVLIPFTTDCLRHTMNGTTEMFILRCKPGNISWLFQAVDAKVTLVCFVPTWHSLTFLWFHPHTLATPWKCQVFSFVEDMWVKIWSKCSCCLHPVLCQILFPKIKISSYS